MNSRLLPNEMIEHIFLFCDDVTLAHLKKSSCFKGFRKKIGIILETRTIQYWNSIQINYVASLMEPIMKTHQKNFFFGGFKFNMTTDGNNFMKEWHNSDAKLSSEMLSMKIHDAILYLKRENERLSSKFPTFSELEGRPYFLNRYLMLSVREMYNMYLPPPQN